jgi:hypothetical protein
VVDYRKFLNKTETITAPWLGGRSIDLPDRRLRLNARIDRPGWYRFEIKGRIATAPSPTDAADLSALPRVRGYLWRERLVLDGARAEPLHLLPEEEAPRFSPVSARRWHGGALLFDTLEFESEVEGAVREALAKGAAIADLKGVPASLRAAYGFALGEQAARRMNVPVTASELRGHVGRIAEGGLEAAEAAIHALVAEREQTERELREVRERVAAAQLRAEVEAVREARARDRRRRADTLEERAWEALEKAGADFESARQLGGDQGEIVFGYLGERFICVVDAVTLQVYDSGICLGHPPADRLITLDSLPSVIREAIETDALVILRSP